MLVEACGISAGQRVLDVATGTGNVAIRTAEAGAEVVASDLTTGNSRRAAARRGPAGRSSVVEADAEALPFSDGEFDVVTSSFGDLPPNHQRVADELLRVCRPSGTIGIANFTPEGLAGDFFQALAPYMPPPPPGALPPVMWGSEEHVRELFGDRTEWLEMTRREYVERAASPSDYCEFFKETFGPAVAIRASLADHPERAAASTATSSTTQRARTEARRRPRRVPLRVPTRGCPQERRIVNFESPPAIQRRRRRPEGLEWPTSARRDRALARPFRRDREPRRRRVLHGSASEPSVFDRTGSGTRDLRRDADQGLRRGRRARCVARFRGRELEVLDVVRYVELDDESSAVATAPGRDSAGSPGSTEPSRSSASRIEQQLVFDDGDRWPRWREPDGGPEEPGGARR